MHASGNTSYKMNTDGACRPHGHVQTNPTDQIMRGPSGYGGILRDNHGKWVCGFRGFIGVDDSLAAELHGIYRGLFVLDELCLEGAILESDCAAAIRMLNNNDIFYQCSRRIMNCWEVIALCNELIEKNRITIRCCSRDANKCADKLANMGIDCGQEHVEIIDLPVEIKDIVDRESSIL